MSDWSSDVCPSDLAGPRTFVFDAGPKPHAAWPDALCDAFAVSGRGPRGTSEMADPTRVPGDSGGQFASGTRLAPEIGSATGREGVCLHAKISVAAVPINTKHHN